MKTYRINYKTEQGETGYFYVKAYGIHTALDRAEYPLSKEDEITQITLIKKVPNNVIFLSERNFQS